MRVVLAVAWYVPGVANDGGFVIQPNPVTDVPAETEDLPYFCLKAENYFCPVRIAGQALVGER